MANLMRKRLLLFKSHRRGYYSFCLLMSLYFISWFGGLICNSRPILVQYKGQYYFPFLVSYPETVFDGELVIETDYKDEEIIARLNEGDNFVIWPLIKFGPTDIDFNLETPAPSPPDSHHILGTDDRARDVFARLLFGFRISLTFGIILALLGTMLGIIAGAVQGYSGGKIDLLGQRFIEIWSSLPELFILIILTSLFEPSLPLIIILMSAMGWMGLAAYVRAEFLRAREFDFVISAIALGASKFRVIFWHILPNTLAPVITFFPFRVSAAISGLASLDFLGLGVPSPTPSLGELLSQGKANLHSWWIIVATFIVMVSMITMLNFMGEAVQKAFDPKA